MPYTKTAWKDHIVDGAGAVVQQGTPLNAQNLNHLEEGVANTAAITAGELGAATAHSGVLEHTAAIEVRGTFNSSMIDRVKGEIMVAAAYAAGVNRFDLGAFTALISGSSLLVKTGATMSSITLDPPPTAGSRDDLVFLEAWRDQTTQAWQTRIRIVAGIDFAIYNKDGFCVDTALLSGSTTNNPLVQAQGGNEAPVSYTDPSGVGSYSFRNAKQRLANGGVWSKNDGDMGLYVAGRGDANSLSILKTYDGYVYAIPLFKVNRRNTGGYSANNPNGARNYFTSVTAIQLNPQLVKDEIRQVTVSTAFAASVQVGDVLGSATNGGKLLRVLSKDSTTLITIQSLATFNVGSDAYGLASDRPDSLYANIIDARDITDLRHKTYLAAPAYEQLLIDGTDQILRGASQVEKKTAMRKTYVGVRKTPIDANHIFYASMDGTVTAEVGTLSTIALGSGQTGFTPMPTGAGYRSPTATANQFTEITPISGLGTTFTIEFFLDMSQSPASSLAARTLFDIKDANNLSLLRLLCNPTTFDTVLLQTATASAAFGTTYSINTPAANRVSKKAHIRLTYNNGLVNLYMDGALLYSLNFTLIRAAIKVGLTRSWIGLEGTSGAETYPGGLMIYSDFAISKVDRGAVFATLPADVIQGYADITPALNYQRRINSDAQTSQKTYATVKVKNATQEPGVTVTKGAGTNTAAWEAGDKIKVRGLAGELISGITDADTARAKILSNTTNQLTLDSVYGLAVSDAVYFRDYLGFADFESTTVTAIDTTSNTITVSSTMTANRYTNQTLYEITASTSSPVVRTIIAGVSTTVTGTWTGLAKNEAEVTLGTLPGGLAAQEIIIEYSLNMPAGQGSLYQVYTKILSGEANGKKLIPGTLAVSDDFIGKVTGSTTVNPHKAYSAVGSALATPSAPGTEFGQADYEAIKTLDNSLKVVTTNVSGQQAQVVIAIDIIRLFEDRYGKIPGAFTISEKKAWLVANVYYISVGSNAYGTGPNGPNINYRTWSLSWASNTSSHTNNTVTLTTLQAGTATYPLAARIDDQGLVWFIAYADPSDGVTASTLYVDQIVCTGYVMTKAGFDTLAPENPRRDAGQAGVLYVRRATREVESLFTGNDEDNGIVIIGDYLPTQEMTAIQTILSGTANLLLGTQNFITTAGTNRAYGTSNAYANAITALLGPGDDLNYKVDPQTLVSTAPYEGSNLSGVIRYWYADFPHALGIDQAAYGAGIPSWAAVAAEFLSGSPRLVLYNGEILLMLKLRKRSALTSEGLGGGSNNYYFRLPGRPLIKL